MHIKDENVSKLYYLIETLGADTIVREWVCYASNDEIKEFVEHCEEFLEIEACA